MNKLNIAIVGCRDFARPERVRALVRYFPGHLVTLVSGHGGNVDLAVEDEAIKQGIDIEVFPADWKKYGKRGGPIRNAQIAELCDAMIAFWDFKSRGTKDAIDKATKLGKPILVVGVEHKLTDKDLEMLYERAVNAAELYKR